PSTTRRSTSSFPFCRWARRCGSNEGKSPLALFHHVHPQLVRSVLAAAFVVVEGPVREGQNVQVAQGAGAPGTGEQWGVNGHLFPVAAVEADGQAGAVLVDVALPRAAIVEEEPEGIRPDDGAGASDAGIP